RRRPAAATGSPPPGGLRRWRAGPRLPRSCKVIIAPGAGQGRGVSAHPFASSRREQARVCSRSASLAEFGGGLRSELPGWWADLEVTLPVPVSAGSPGRLIGVEGPPTPGREALDSSLLPDRPEREHSHGYRRPQPFARLRPLDPFGTAEADPGRHALPAL